VNNQEAFDTVVLHLISMKEQSIDEDGECKYRGAYNQSCAVGVLIPDNQYKPWFENKSVYDIYDNVPELKEISRELLHDLQKAHDNDLNWGSNGFVSISKFEDIAEKYRLTIPKS